VYVPSPLTLHTRHFCPLAVGICCGHRVDGCRNFVSAALNSCLKRLDVLQGLYHCHALNHLSLVFNDVSTAYAVERQCRTTRIRTCAHTQDGAKVTWNSMFNNRKAMSSDVSSCAHIRFARSTEGGWGRRLGNGSMSAVLAVGSKLSVLIIPLD
jgi:hypothetical protein